MFDFLKEVVSRVPDYSHGHSDAGGEDRAISKRRLEEKFLFFLPFSLTLIYIYIYIFILLVITRAPSRSWTCDLTLHITL